MAVELHVQNITSGIVPEASVFRSDDFKTVKIGRLRSAELCLSDPAVSPVHAVIELRELEAVLTDMGAGLGTTVNGEQVRKHTLAHGDTLKFGDTVLAVGLGAPALEKSKGASLGATPLFDEEDDDTVPSGLVRERERQPGASKASVMEMRVLWGRSLQRVEHYRRPGRITIGESERATVLMSREGLPCEDFPLIRHGKGGHLLTFSEGMQGEVELGGQVYSLRSLRGSTLAKEDGALPGCYGVVLDVSSRCLIHWGGLSFAFRFVPAFKSVGGLFSRGIDYPYLNTALFSLFAHVAVIVALMIYPIQAEKLGRDTFGGAPDRFISLILTAPPIKPVSNAILERMKKKRRPPELEKKLVPDPTAPAGEMESKGSDESRSKAQNRVEVRKRFARLFDDGGAAGGIIGNRGGGGNLFGGLAKVIGTMGPGTASADLAGLGLRRDMLMGGGLGTSKTATEIGTSGRLGAGDAGVEYGVGVQIGKRQRRVVSLSTPTIMGALSRDVVQKVIDRNKNQIRYCYELDLQRNQDLAGRIAFQWTIEATGRVGEVVIKESTLGNQRVEQCMVHRIRTWRFPAPAGGGVVEVHYPFVFKAN